MSDGDFLSRWSRRKHEARRAERPQDAVPEALEPPPAEPPTNAPAAVLQAPDSAPAPLPPVESLTSESDFAPFMRPDVDAGLRRAALKTLFADPRFNVMDGLDVYIDDYSKPDPLPEGWLEKLNQLTHLGHRQPPVEEAAVPAPPAEPAPEVPPEVTPPQESAKPESEGGSAA